MVQINFAQKTVNAKIVYYGPGMSGKTTNLEVVHQRAPEKNRGELTSISTDGDRTLFFDYMPLDLGTVAGMRTAFQIYTVPGQVYYNSTRKLVLQGVDGVVFVADSSAAMLEQNLESLRNLEENLVEYGKTLASLPHVIQYNKRDLPDAMPVAELDRHLNVHGAPTFEAVASSGQGVFPTLKALAACVLKNIMRESQGRTPAKPAAAPMAAAAPAMARGPMAAAPAARELDIAPSAGLGGGSGGGYTPGAPAAPRGPSPAPMMQVPQAPRPAPAPAPMPRPQPRAPQPQPQAAPTATQKSRASTRREVAVPAEKGGNKTMLFVLAAAGVGAVIAYVLLRVL
jgi:hypothetical protein